jgi:hypothetical protein
LTQLTTDLNALNGDVNDSKGSFKIAAPFTIPNLASSSLDGINSNTFGNVSAAFDPLRPPSIPDFTQTVATLNLVFDNVTDFVYKSVLASRNY